MLFVAWVFSHFLPVLECLDGSGRREDRPAGHLVAEWCAGPGGVKDGPQVVYYANGVRMAMLHYKNGVRDGPGEFSLNNRTLWRRDEYRDGENVFEWLNPAAASLSEEQNTALGGGSCGGVLPAIVCTSGDRRPECRNLSPRLPRPRVVRLVDGGKARGRYDHGTRSGEWVFWDARGNRIKQAKFTRGELDRSFGEPYREWYADGKPKTEGQYSSGRKVGIWRSWSADGILKEVNFGDRWAAQPGVEPAGPSARGLTP